jgi:hypothetical protein
VRVLTKKSVWAAPVLAAWLRASAIGWSFIIDSSNNKYDIICIFLSTQNV